MLLSCIPFGQAVYAAEKKTKPQRQTHRPLKLLGWRRKKINAYAQNQLGKADSYDKGIAENFKEAAKWYKKAATHGHFSAIEFLAKYYLDE